MKAPIIVSKLAVRAVSNEAEDFSAIYAEIETSDKTLIKELTGAKQQKTPVALRCAMLDVTGCITKSVRGISRKTFILAIDDICFRPPRLKQSPESPSPPLGSAVRRGRGADR